RGSEYSWYVPAFGHGVVSPISVPVAEGPNLPSLPQTSFPPTPRPPPALTPHPLRNLLISHADGLGFPLMYPLPASTPGHGVPKPSPPVTKTPPLPAISTQTSPRRKSAHMYVYAESPGCCGGRSHGHGMPK